MQWEKYRAQLAVAAVTAVGGVLGLGVLYQSQGAGVAAASSTQFEVPAAGDGVASSPTPGPPSSTDAATPPEASSAPAPAPVAEMQVYVLGAVKKPGVYGAKPGMRINDAIKMAGGFRTDADQESLNLADYVRDADKIQVVTKAEVKAARAAGGAASAAPRRRSVVTHGGPPPAVLAFDPPPMAAVRKPAPVGRPSVGKIEPLVVPAPPAAAPKVSAPTVAAAPEAVPTPGRVLGGVPDAASDPAIEEVGAAAPTASTAKSGSRSGSAAKFKNPGDGVVNINTAGSADLQKLPGVGPSTAEKILEYRQQIGRFTDISQLQDVKGTFTSSPLLVSVYVAPGKAPRIEIERVG